MDACAANLHCECQYSLGTKAQKPEGTSMNQADTRVVTDANGQRGVVESLPDPQNNVSGMVGVRLENGQKLLVPQSVLTTRADGSFYLPFALSEFLTASAGGSNALTATASGQNAGVAAATNVASAQAGVQTLEHQSRTAEGEIVIPLAAERVAIGKRVVETGGVRITKTVTEREETADVPLLSDHVEVERVAVNRVLDTPPEVRRDGEVLIVPILEEVLVVEKRLMLREELHIRMTREETHQPQQVILRREDVQIERFTRDLPVVAEASTSVSEI